MTRFLKAFITLIALLYTYFEQTLSSTEQTRKIADRLYCDPSLCLRFNGTHMVQQPHIGCQNSDQFATSCGSQPHLIRMGERRRNFIVELHNLARSRIAEGQVAGYPPASRMPLLKWNNELEYLAELNVKMCHFDHDRCHNTHRFRYSGQNIGFFWINRAFISHSKRMKSFIANWFREYKDANQTFIDQFQRHPEGKKIEHFTMMVADRAHHVGCAAIRYRDPNQPNIFKFLMTCNYDFNNLIDEPVYRTGRTASKCGPHGMSKKFPALCDWISVKADDS